MTAFKTQVFAILVLLTLSSFSQCSSDHRIQDKAPLEIGEVYFQKWIAGIEGAGSGINIFILTKQSTIVLDSVYFRNRRVKLESNPKDSILYIGRFKTEFNQGKDMVMSNEPNAEINNPIPDIDRKFPFSLKDDECIISFKQGEITRYFKIENITEKRAVSYPSPPPNKQ